MVAAQRVRVDLCASDPALNVGFFEPVVSAIWPVCLQPSVPNGLVYGIASDFIFSAYVFDAKHVFVHVWYLLLRASSTFSRVIAEKNLVHRDAGNPADLNRLLDGCRFWVKFYFSICIPMNSH